MRRRLAPAGALGLAMLLGGCAVLAAKPAVAPSPGQPPPSKPAAAAAPPKVVRIFVPKPVKCVPEDLGPPPAYPDNDVALREAGGAADRYQLLAAGRILRQQRLEKLEEVVRRCRNAAR